MLKIREVLVGFLCSLDKIVGSGYLIPMVVVLQDHMRIGDLSEVPLLLSPIKVCHLSKIHEVEFALFL